ncbi:MAG TPA: PH domain-containing protein [Allosphingosinicella sp.]|jgi:hypothetical protein|nr:PH domain-containing protein [Allosphingosinicella sp.]
MRIFDVDQATPADVRDHSETLLAGEEVHAAFTSQAGAILFTDRRIVLVTRENLLEERVETSSYPYREVRRFALQESAGGDGFRQLRVWLGNEEHPLQLRARTGADLHALQRLLAEKLV